jgi:hypothetical protein
MPPSSSPSPAEVEPVEEPEEDEGERAATDDDLQVFLKSLGKNAKT